MRTFREASFRRTLATFYRPWYRRVLPWFFLTVGLLVAGRLSLSPLVERWSQRWIGGIEGLRGHHREVELFTFPPVYVIEGLTFGPGGDQPVFSAERVEVHTDWKQVLKTLLGRTPTVRLRLARPKLNLQGDRAPLFARALDDLLARLPRVHVELAGVSDGELLITVPMSDGRPRTEALLSKIEAAFENFHPARRAGRLPPGTVTGTASLLGGGESYFRIHFAEAESVTSGELRIRHLSLGDIYLFLDGWAPRDLSSGSLAFSAKFASEAGRLGGAMRTASVNVLPTDLPPALIERLRGRLGHVAPWVSLVIGPSETDAPEELTFEGLVIPNDTGRWLQAIALARSLVIEGVVAAVKALPDPDSLAAEQQGN
jgi:hypothetical protein